MEHSTLTVAAADGTPLHVNRWLPGDSSSNDSRKAPRGVVQIAHGMAEHSDRYERFAQALTDAGYAVYANDHRGHKGTAGTHEDEGYLADDNGFEVMVDDLAAVTARIREEQPGLPVVLFGHSMGSFISRAYAARHATGANALAGLILSGTAGDPGLLGAVGAQLASLQARLRGRRHTSGLMNTLSFGQYNANFKPARTDFDWLSRDPAEVDKYIDDEWCGNVFTAGFFADLLPGLRQINTDALVAKVPKDLPILVLAGDKDPVGDNGKGPAVVAEQYRRAGITDVTLTLYPGGRHEMLNETNRDEVTADILRWLDRALG
jgi:alpha-beta hydrolase superfamily lysophospholipase